MTPPIRKKLIKAALRLKAIKPEEAMLIPPPRSLDAPIRCCTWRCKYET
jgi:hypothetical protein